MIELSEVLARAIPLSEERYTCIYFLIKDNEIVYVGESGMGKFRIGYHLAKKDFDSYAVFKIDIQDRAEREIFEREHIAKFNPKYNSIPVYKRTTVKTSLGIQIREAMKERGYSNKKLAGEIGCSVCALYSWKRGRSYPCKWNLAKLERVLGRLVK